MHVQCISRIVPRKLFPVQIKWQEEPQVTSLHIGHLQDTALSSGEKYFEARALSTSLSFGTVYIVKSDFTEIYLILAFKI